MEVHSERAAAASPPSWLAQVFETHHRAVYATAYRVTGSVTDAEDVLQTIFTRLLRRADPPPLDGIGGYLHRAAVHGSLDVLRGRQRAGWVPLEDTARLGDAVDEVERRDESARLRRGLRLALSRMSPRAAEAFALRYFEGLSNLEIATALGTSAAVVAVLLHRTRARLRKDLAAWMGA
jgi:RNA polymerase sigma-70 factor (ECF subfamily)